MLTLVQPAGSAVFLHGGADMLYLKYYRVITLSSGAVRNQNRFSPSTYLPHLSTFIENLNETDKKN